MLSAIEKADNTAKTSNTTGLTVDFLNWAWHAMGTIGVFASREGCTHRMPLPTAFWLVLLKSGARTTN
jgi:hypothetical protein